MKSILQGLPWLSAEGAGPIGHDWLIIKDMLLNDFQQAQNDVIEWTQFSWRTAIRE